MKTIIQAVLITGAVGIAALAAPPQASAQVGITLNFGDVADAYRDGYWDSHHRWHRWQHANDYRDYSRAHPEHYHDMRHDDHDHGH